MLSVFPMFNITSISGSDKLQARDSNSFKTIRSRGKDGSRVMFCRTNHH